MDLVRNSLYRRYIFVGVSVLTIILASCKDDGGMEHYPSLAIGLYMYNVSPLYDSIRVHPLYTEMSDWPGGEWHQFTAVMWERTFAKACISDSLKYLGVLLLQKPELYHYMRIPIERIELWKDNVQREVKIQDSLDYPFSFPALKSSSDIDLVIDLNAAVSIIKIERGTNAEYYFRDRTRLAGIVRGEIQGTVINNRNQGIAYCILEKDTVTSGVACGNPGNFHFRFLSKGNYTVSITDSLGSNYITTVPLGEGQKVNLGDITLR